MAFNGIESDRIVYPIILDGMDGYSHYKPGPHDVEALKGAQEAVEYVVGGEHWHHWQRLIQRVVEDSVGQETDARHHPAQREHHEYAVGQPLLLHVGGHLSALSVDTSVSTSMRAMP